MASMMSAKIEFQKLACETLQLVHPDDKGVTSDLLLELGHFRILESPAALDAVVELYLERLGRKAIELEKAYLASEPEFSAPREASRLHAAKFRPVFDELNGRSFMSFNRFAKCVGRESSLGDDCRVIGNRYGSRRIRLYSEYKLAVLEQRGKDFSNSRSGYQRYLKAVVPKFYKFLNEDVPVLVREKYRTRHTYFLATTGAGKSEMLKALCLNYVQQPEYAGLVVLDPGGDMVQQMAHWPELTTDPTQLVYIDPSLDSEKVPVINPFDAEGLSEEERENLTGQIVAALGVLIEGKAGGDITVPMQNALYNAVRLLVDLPDTSLLDLENIMRDDEHLLDLGRRSPVRRVAQFFELDFKNVHKTTKYSIISKLGSFLGPGRMEQILCGRTSIDLRHLLDVERKIVLVNLAKGRLDPVAATALGTLIISTVLSIGMKRSRIDERLRPVTHLIVDECQNFVTGKLKDIIREGRKFGTPVTLAQQEYGAEMPDDLRNVVVKTTNVKIVGRSSKDETRKTGELVGVDQSDILACETGQFFYQAGTAPPFKLRVRSDRIGDKEGIDKAFWEVVVAYRQTQKYYRSVHDRPEMKRRSKPEEPEDEPTGSSEDMDFG